MRPLSATECISPAMERTRLVLFAPFRKGRTWKLCATAYLCRGGTIFFPFPLIYLAFLPAAFRAGGTLAATALCVGVVLCIAFFAWIFHLCSRLQFAYFDMVINRGEFVAPAWRKYRRQALPWSGFKFLFGTALTLACAFPILAFFRRLMPLMAAMGTIQPGQPPPPQFIQAIFAMYAGYGLFMVIFGLLFLVSSLLSDFIVPSLALEDTGLGEAFRRMGELIRQEPGEFALYVLLKVALGMAAYLCAIIAWEIAFILVTLLVGGVLFAFGYLLYMIGVPKLLLMILAFLAGAAWYLFALVYSMMLAIGPVLTYLDAYAIYFLGGRYPMLGDLIDRSTPPPAYRAPPPYPVYLTPPPPPTGS